MGQSGNQQNQNTVPGVRIDISQLRPTTRFNDLHEDLQKQIENLDKFILAQEQQAHDCNAIMPSHAEQLSFVPENVDFLSRKLIGVETSLEGDAQDVALVRKLVHVDTENAKLSFRATDNLKLPRQFHQGIWNAPKPPPSSSSGDSTTTDPARDLVSFFSETADEMKSTLAKYKGRIGEIELHLRTVEANIMQAQVARGVNPTDSIQELAAVFRDFEMGILGVAGEVGGVRESFQRLALGGFVDENIRHGSGKRRGVY
jgi:nucleoporin p58/p45